MAALPVTIDSAGELRDEFRMQTSPEPPRAEVGSKDGEEDVEEQEEEDNQIGQSLGKGKGSLNKEVMVGERKGLNKQKMPSAPPASALTSSYLHDVGCRRNQQVCYNVQCYVFSKCTFISASFAIGNQFGEKAA